MLDREMIVMSVYATSLMYYFESLTKPQGMLIQKVNYFA